MTVIDARDNKGLTQERFQQFIDNVNDEQIDIYKDNINKLFSCKKEDLVKDFFTVIADVQEADIFIFQTSSATLKFLGKDFLWWTKTSKRLEKLEVAINSRPIEKKTKKKIDIIDDKTYYIGIATLVDNELTNIHHFEGSKKDCIDFINQDMLDRYIDNMLDAKIVINFAFDIEEFERVFSDTSTKEEKETYKKNIEMWYTIDELEQMGAITVR